MVLAACIEQFARHQHVWNTGVIIFVLSFMTVFYAFGVVIPVAYVCLKDSLRIRNARKKKTGLPIGVLTLCIPFRSNVYVGVCTLRFGAWE